MLLRPEKDVHESLPAGKLLEGCEQGWSVHRFIMLREQSRKSMNIAKLFDFYVYSEQLSSLNGLMNSYIRYDDLPVYKSRPMCYDVDKELGKKEMLKIEKNYAYISYAHADFKIVKDNILYIAQRHAVWLDTEKLKTGDRCTDEIKDRIKGCSCFIVFLSMNYGDCAVCHEEINTALKYKHPVCAIFKDTTRNVKASRFGEEILDRIKSFSQAFEESSQGNTLLRHNEVLLNIARRHHIDKVDCIKGRPELFFATYIPVFDKPLAVNFKYAYDHMPGQLRLIGRDKDLAYLHEFMDSDKLWTLIIGHAGSGKSKLCYMFAKNMHEKGWAVHYLECSLSEKLKRLNRKLSNDTLIVIDAPISHSMEVSDFLYYFPEKYLNGFRLKVILLERDMRHRYHDAHVLDPSRYFTFLVGKEAELMPKCHALAHEIEPLQRDSLLIIMKQYTRIVHGKELDEDASRMLLDILFNDMDPFLHRPLYAIFLADDWAFGHDSSNRDSVLRYILAHEQEVWLAKARIQGNDAKVFIQAMMCIIACAIGHEGCPFDMLASEELESMQTIKALLPGKKSTKAMDYLKEIGVLEENQHGLFLAGIQPRMLGECIIRACLQPMA